MRYSFFTILILSVTIFSLTGSGCGKKGDPLPPLLTVSDPPAELTYSLDIDNSTAILKWNYPVNNDDNAKSASTDGQNSEIKGVEIFRARLELSDNACKGCPLEFENIASVPFSVSEYRQTVEKGFIYFYKVRSYKDNNISSLFSETVTFEFR